MLRALLLYTEDEWNIIHNVLSREFHPDDDIHAWLRKRIERLQKNENIIHSLTSCNTPENKRKVAHYISQHQKQFFKELELTKGIKCTSAINNLIIIPSLTEYVLENGFGTVNFQ